MNIVVNKAEDGAIEFLSSGMVIYDITKESQKGSLQHWLPILSEKRWFTPLVRSQTIEAWDN